MNVLEQFKLLSGMSTTRRYSQTKLHAEESILEHSAFVGIVAHMIASEYNNLMSNCNSFKADLGLIAQKALFHDMEEFLTGDIPRTTKYSSPESLEAFEKIADEGMKTVLLSLEISKTSEENSYMLWKNSKEGFEGMFIALADLSAVVYKLYTEVTLMGNKTLLFVCKNIQVYIDSRVETIKKFCDASTPGYYFLMDYMSTLKKISSEAGFCD